MYNSIQNSEMIKYNIKKIQFQMQLFHKVLLKSILQMSQNNKLEKIEKKAKKDW